MQTPKSDTSREVLKRFYDTESDYMKAGGGGAGAGFDDIAATIDPAVLLHQSPDLPSVVNTLATNSTASWGRR